MQTNFNHMSAPRRTRGSTVRMAAMAVILGAILLISAGCKRSGSATLDTEQSSSVVIEAVLDTSASNRDNLPKETDELANLTLRVDSSSSWLSVFRIDSDLRQLHDGPIPDSGEAFLSDLLPALQPLTGKDNTYVQRALVAVSERLRGISGQAVVILWTDWYCEGMTASDHSTLTNAAKELANNRQVRAVMVVGAAPSNTEALHKDLAPLAKKLRVFQAGSLDEQLVADLLASGGAQ